MISKAGHYEPIAREGYVFFVPPALIAIAAWWLDYPWISLAFLAMSAAIASFFRNPERTPPQDEGIVLSPADGRVVEIVENTGSENMEGLACKRISIFMSVLNVHVNRCPVSGIVEKIAHVPGKFLDAREPAASMINEHNSVVFQAKDGPFEVVQIAGIIARRIACWIREGDKVRQGERFGLIRFGSRLDVYLPQENFSFIVSVGDRVKAGESIIARRDRAAKS